jgi:hypothetical protein
MNKNLRRSNLCSAKGYQKISHQFLPVFLVRPNLLKIFAPWSKCNTKIVV